MMYIPTHPGHVGLLAYKQSMQDGLTNFSTIYNVN